MPAIFHKHFRYLKCPGDLHQNTFIWKFHDWDSHSTVWLHLFLQKSNYKWDYLSVKWVNIQPYSHNTVYVWTGFTFERCSLFVWGFQSWFQNSGNRLHNIWKTVLSVGDFLSPGFGLQRRTRNLGDVLGFHFLYLGLENPLWMKAALKSKQTECPCGSFIPKVVCLTGSIHISTIFSFFVFL